MPQRVVAMPAELGAQKRPVEAEKALRRAGPSSISGSADNLVLGQEGWACPTPARPLRRAIRRGDRLRALGAFTCTSKSFAPHTSRATSPSRQRPDNL